MKNKIDVEGWMVPMGDERTRLMPEVKVVVWTKTTCFEGRSVDAPWDGAVKYRITFIPPKVKGLSDQLGVSASETQKGGDHYLKMGVQPWDVVDTWSKEQQIGYHLGNILKYTMRFGKKDTHIVSAEKLAHYAQKLLEVVSK